MGLFSGRAKREAAEQYVRKSLSTVPILDDLIHTVMISEKEWIKSCQGYYDNRKRQVVVQKDLFQIRWGNPKYDNSKESEEGIVDSFNLAYTQAGYVPLHHYVTEEYPEVSTQRVLSIWANVIRDHMKAQMPECAFFEVNEYDGFAVFTYMVPKIQWKQWF